MIILFIAYVEAISEIRFHLRVITSDLCKCLLFHLFSFLSLRIVDERVHSLTDLRVFYLVFRGVFVD
jgi:hypothetical protein